MTSSLNLLLVDASPPSRYALRLLLQRHGARVRTAESAEHALAWIDNDAPDAVLTACVLPGMNGLELLEILRTDPAKLGIPVVICCPDDSWPLAPTALRRGALAILRRDRLEQELPGVLDQIRTALTRRPPEVTPEPRSEAWMRGLDALARIWRRWHVQSRSLMLGALCAGFGVLFLNFIVRGA